MVTATRILRHERQSIRQALSFAEGLSVKIESGGAGAARGLGQSDWIEEQDKIVAGFEKLENEEIGAGRHEKLEAIIKDLVGQNGSR